MPKDNNKISQFEAAVKGISDEVVETLHDSHTGGATVTTQAASNRLESDEEEDVDAATTETHYQPLQTQGWFMAHPPAGQVPQTVYPPHQFWVNPAYMAVPNYWGHHPQNGRPLSNWPTEPYPGAMIQHYPPPPINPSEYRDFISWQQSQRMEHEHPPSCEAWNTYQPHYPPGKEVEHSQGTISLKTNLNRKRKSNRKDCTNISVALYPEETNESLDAPWADLCEGAVFVCPSLRGDVSDALYVAMAQFKPTALTQDDRVGKYKNRELGFTGLCCKFCNGTVGYGRFFPGSYDSFLNGTNCAVIVKHIKEDCTLCPERVRECVQQLDLINDPSRPETTTTPQGRPRYGSRKRFFSYVWAKLRSTTVNAEEMDITGDQVEHEEEIGYEMNETLENLVKNASLVSMKDKNLVSNATLAAMAQMQECQLTEEDRVGRCKDHKLGFKGLCCKHCGGKSGKPGFGRYFPSSLRSLSQADSCQQIVRHITSKCTECPTEIRIFIVELERLHGQKDDQRIKYGSRKIFFQRVWKRLHGVDDPALTDGEDEINEVNEQGKDQEAVTRDKSKEVVPWERLLGNSPVVSVEDKGLVSHAQLVALAQMDRCKLTESDRVGWFKCREVGFGGLCCRHCGGRPSFGRYFPNSVRSFAQTTSSQTIISHLTIYCQACPQEIRDWIQEFVRRESDSNQSAQYGSRKTFFDRVWKRIHGTDADDTETNPVDMGEVCKKQVVEEPEDDQNDPNANRVNTTATV